MELLEMTSSAPAITVIDDLSSVDLENVKNERLKEAIQRVLILGGVDELECRFDRQHHRHNKS